jgi:hypothetical protein
MQGPLTLHIFLSKANGYVHTQLPVVIGANEDLTWGGLFTHIQRLEPYFSYLEAHFHCWVVPNRLTTIMYLVGAAIGAYQLYHDIGLIEMSGITMDLSLRRVFVNGSLIHLFMHGQRDDYPFLSDQRYQGVDPRTVARGSVDGYHVYLESNLYQFLEGVFINCRDVSSMNDDQLGL